jgi:hypothetical protein
LLGAGGVLDEPMLVVDLDGRANPEVVAAAVAAAAQVERILVGVATEAVDPVLDPLLAALDVGRGTRGRRGHGPRR